MSEQTQGMWTPIEDSKKAAHFLVFVSRCLSAPIEPVLRTRFGINYFGMASVVGFFLLPMWTGFYPEENSDWMMFFWFFTLFMQVRARLESARMVARGEFVYSRYNGWPRLARFFPKMPEERIKVGPEPLCVCLIGIFLMPLSQALGSYLVVAGFASGLNGAIIESVERARALQLNDALVEQQLLAERLRRMREQN